MASRSLPSGLALCLLLGATVGCGEPEEDDGLQGHWEVYEMLGKAVDPNHHFLVFEGERLYRLDYNPNRTGLYDCFVSTPAVNGSLEGSALGLEGMQYSISGGGNKLLVTKLVGDQMVTVFRANRVQGGVGTHRAIDPARFACEGPVPMSITGIEGEGTEAPIAPANDADREAISNLDDPIEASRRVTTFALVYGENLEETVSAALIGVSTNAQFTNLALLPQKTVENRMRLYLVLPEKLVAGLYILALLGTSSSAYAQVFILQGEKGEPGQCAATCLTTETLETATLQKHASFHQVSWDEPSQSEFAVLGSLAVDLPRGRYLVLARFHTAGAAGQDSLYEFELWIDSGPSGFGGAISQPSAWPNFLGHDLAFVVLQLEAGTHNITLYGRHSLGQGQLTGGAYVAIVQL